MIATVIKRALGWLLVFLPALAYAEVPSGHYENHFDRQPYGVWDLSGTYSNSMYLGGLLGEGLFNFTLVQDDKGKIRGEGTVAGSRDGYNATANFTASGSIKSGGNTMSAVLKTVLIAAVTDGHTIWNAKGNVKLTGKVDKPTSLLRGSVKGKVCAQGEGCESVSEKAELPLPVETHGAWDLHLEITNVNGKKLTGTATAVLHNADGAIRNVPFTLSGQYNAQTNLTKLTLKGSGGKFTIRANVSASQLIFQSMKGKMLGQTVQFP